MSCTCADKLREGDDIRLIAASAIPAGAIWQMSNGLAAVNIGPAAAVGDPARFVTSGQFTVEKKSGIVVLNGGRLYWDRDNGYATFKRNFGRNFYLGTAVGDAASTDLTVAVNLNVLQHDIISLARDGFSTAIVKTAGAPSLNRRGGGQYMTLDATNEAQKVDALSKDKFANDGKAIVELIFSGVSYAGGGSPDLSMGIASTTHASDADSITQVLFLHMDGGSNSLKAESRDGTTTVAKTSTGVTPLSGGRDPCEVWLDMRDTSSVKIYVDGVQVLASTVFNVSAAASQWCLLAHLEKTASTDVYEIDIDRLAVRTMEQ